MTAPAIAAGARANIMDDFFAEYLEETSVAVGELPARLEIRNGPEDGRVFPIATETVRIGRQLAEPERLLGGANLSNFIIRSDKAISREHCELTALSSTTFLFPLPAHNKIKITE